MKVGLIGTGPWGLTLARAFQKQGVEIAAHAHERPHRVDGLGKRMSWAQMIGAAGIDAVIAAGPPDVTLEAVKMCQGRGVPVLATKPLMLEAPLALAFKTPMYVDYVHLWSTCYQALKEEVEARKGHLKIQISSITCDFSGPGPKRDFSSLRDYGPHALAFAFDLLNCGNAKINSVSRVPGMLPGCENYRIGSHVNGVPIVITVGNGSAYANRMLVVTLGDGTDLIYQESKPSASFTIKKNEKLNIAHASHSHNPLVDLISTFISNVKTGRLDTHSMDLSVSITKAITAIETLSARSASQ